MPVGARPGAAARRLELQSSESRGRLNPDQDQGSDQDHRHDTAITA